jgi:hypothetical protein
MLQNIVIPEVEEGEIERASRRWIAITAALFYMHSVQCFWALVG